MSFSHYYCLACCVLFFREKNGNEEDEKELTEKCCDKNENGKCLCEKERIDE